MSKVLVSIALAVCVLFLFSGCENLGNSELIQELRTEIEMMTEELNQLNDELEDVVHERDSMEYERDAFLDDNIITRQEKEMLEERIENFDTAMEENFNNYVQKRRNLGELIIYLKEIGATPYFDQEIKETHKEAILEYITVTGAGTFFVSDDEFTSFILSPIHIKNGIEVETGHFMYQTVLLGDSSPVEYPSQYIIPEDTGSDLFDDVVFIVEEKENDPEVIFFGLTPAQEE
jgi:hypothetical protein